MAITPLHLVPDPRSLAQAIIDTVRTPLLVLDSELKVIAASRSYYGMFRSDEEQTFGRSLYDLADGQWNIPELRALIEAVSGNNTIEAYEIEFDLTGLGRRTLLMDAREVFYAEKHATNLLLGFEDVTLLRTATREKDEALRQQTMLLQEMHHRVANSLQIIASILMLKARSVNSEEIRGHLKDAHRRVMSVAAVQSHLQATPFGDEIEVGPYLATLADGLSASMIHDQRPVALSVEAGPGKATSTRAISLGLIVTELVINALKYAFVGGEPGRIVVAYSSSPAGWTLSVADDGQGLSEQGPSVGAGLGSSLIAALATQLNARVERRDLHPGLSVAITSDHAYALPGGAFTLEVAS